MALSLLLLLQLVLLMVFDFLMEVVFVFVASTPKVSPRYTIVARFTMTGQRLDPPWQIGNDRSPSHPLVDLKTLYMLSDWTQ